MIADIKMQRRLILVQVLRLLRLQTPLRCSMGLGARNWKNCTFRIGVSTALSNSCRAMFQMAATYASSCYIGKGVIPHGDCWGMFSTLCWESEIAKINFAGVYDFGEVTNSFNMFLYCGSEGKSEINLRNFVSTAESHGSAFRDLGSNLTTFYVPDDWFEWAPGVFGNNSCATNGKATYLYKDMPWP